MSHKILILSEQNVKDCLDMKECLEMNRKAFIAVARGDAHVPTRLGIPYQPPPRSELTTDNKDATNNVATDWTLFKPAAYVDPTLKYTSQLGMKLVSIRARNPAQYQLPLVPATILSVNSETGQVQALVAATYLTAARTATGSALSTVQHKPHLQRLVVFGAGLQAQLHLHALSTALGASGRRIPHVTIVNRSLENAQTLAALAKQQQWVQKTHVVALSDRPAVAACLRQTDVVVACTNTTQPLFDDNLAQQIPPGTHLCGVGSYTPDMQEYPHSVVNRCRVWIDTPEARTVGDLKHLPSDHPVTLLGTALQQQQQQQPDEFGFAAGNSNGHGTSNGNSNSNGPHRNRNDNRYDCTLFKSVGTAIQDVLTADLVVQNAKAKGNMGREVDMLENPSTIAQHNFYFLSDQAAHNLPLYQYRGQDLSLWYKYVSGPLATFCVNHLTPSWVAPNLITLTGFLLMFTSYASFWYYLPLMQYDNTDTTFYPPRWIFLWNAIAMWCYQTMDNMDGRQARKTKTSSPLGLLFDHGIDAANSVFGSANIILTLGLHPYHHALQCLVLWMAPYGLFYVSTWEEYFTGELIMPIFNGPNEGLNIGATMSLVSWWYGPTIWQLTNAWTDYLLPNLPSLLTEQVATWHVSNADLFVILGTLGACQEVTFKGLHVMRNYSTPRALAYLLPFVALVVCVLVVGTVDRAILVEMPHTSLHLVAGLFVEMTTDLMFAHVTALDYQIVPHLAFLVPLVGLTLAVALGGVRQGQNTDHFLLVYTSAFLGFLVLKFAVLIHEICTLLGIQCLSIPTTPKTKEKEDPRPNHTPQKQKLT